MKREKGFTLIELLAVIVILAVISLIAMPMIMDIINKSRENAVKASAENYVHAVEVEAFNLQTDNLIDISDGTFSTTELDRYVTYSGPKVKGRVTLKDGMVTGYDLYINGYRVKKDGDGVTTELSDGQVHNEVNEIDVVRGGETVHITNSSELQDGDVFVNGQYEYHYNAVYVFSYITYKYEWDNDTSLNGWSMKLSDDALEDEVIDTPMVTKIVGKDIISMSYLFYTSNAKTIDLSSFDTSKVTNMAGMFSDCYDLTSIDVSGFNTSNVTSMHSMFLGCSSLTSLDISGFVTSKVTNMMNMFCDCSSLTSLDVSSFDTSKVTDMDCMFTDCSKLINLDVSGFDTSNVTNMQSMFNGCEKLINLDVSGFETSKVTDMSNMFSDCSSLTSLDLSNFNTLKVIFMSNMFAGCGSLTSLDLSGFDTSKVTYMSWMFSECSSLTSLDLSSFDTSKVTNMAGMFSDCYDLTSIDVSSFDTSSVIYMQSMFSNCNNLASIYVGEYWNISNVRYSSNMFSGCTSLIGGSGTVFDSSKTDKTYAKIDGGTSDPGYFWRFQ